VTEVKARKATGRTFAGTAPTLDEFIVGDFHVKISDTVEFSEKGEKKTGVRVGARRRRVGAIHDLCGDSRVTEEAEIVEKGLTEEGGAEGLAET
jgi:hypothetical protein